MTGSLLITGASSGLGLETAVYFAERGFQVFATMREPNRRAALEAEAQRRNTTVQVLPLDVTDPASVTAAVETVIARCGRLDCLVNNAGIQLRGFFEDLDPAEIHRVFETNVFGTMAVTAAALPYMRAARRGRIVLVTSVAARLASPALTAYCASKSALEAFGESLAMELAGWGISVSMVAPGVIRTPFWEANRRVSSAARVTASPYADWFRESERLTDWAVRSSPTQASDVARTVYRACTATRPRLRYLVGGRAAVLLAVRRLLPEEWFMRLFSAFMMRQLTRPAHRKAGTY